MQCKRCKAKIDKEELQARFEAGIGHCPNPDCPRIDWELTKKYDRIITLPAEFEEDDLLDHGCLHGREHEKGQDVLGVVCE